MFIAIVSGSGVHNHNESFLNTHPVKLGWHKCSDPWIILISWNYNESVSVIFNSWPNILFDDDDYVDDVTISLLQISIWIWSNAGYTLQNHIRVCSCRLLPNAILQNGALSELWWESRSYSRTRISTDPRVEYQYSNVVIKEKEILLLL